MTKRTFFAMVFLALALGAGAADWFDTGISGYTQWPSDGSDFLVPGAGTWTGTANAKLVSTNGLSRLNVMTPGPGDALAFESEVARDMADNLLFRVTATFCLFCELPNADPSFKTALTALEKKNGQAVYCGFVADGDSGTNCWAELSGATPRDGEEVEIEVSMRTTAGGSLVRYVVDGTPLARNGSEWLPIVVADGSDSISEVGYVGRGELAALSAEADGTATPTALTIPAITGMELVSVMVGETEVVQSNGTYTVASGSRVVVTFQPTAGRVLSTTTMSFRAAGDAMELPVDGRPVSVLAADVLRVNEVMASNETVLNTAGGVPALDWVEIRNTADFDIDITGWPITDDPTKVLSKWKQVAGPAVVPAHGYLVVYLDSSFSDWDPRDVHAPLGLSASGEGIGLAMPDGTVVSQYTFGQQMDDVSFGYGHLAKTLLNRYAPAEYKVGNGAWTSVAGPVGMPGTANGFQVVAYAMNVAVDTMDAAELCLRDSSKWNPGYPVTNVCATIAFQDKSSQTNFPPYSAFPGVSGDNFVVVVTGTVQVPEAGLWSFSVGSDDGFSAKISRLEKSWSWENRGARSYGQSTATFNLPEAGAYDVELVYFEKGGGAALDFSVAQGEQDFSAAAFRLVGSAASGLTHTGALGANMAVDLTDVMAGTTASVDWRGSFTLDAAPAAGEEFRLRIRYADGFTARLNGTQFVSVPAAGARSAQDALTPAFFDIPLALVRAGENTLEVTGFNDSAGDAAFFLSPEVVWDMADEQLLYFPEATPGAANGDGRSGLTPEVSFSVPHGYKTEPFQLELSCPENPTAAIFYTTDGTSPTPMSPRYTGPIAVSSTTVVRAAVPDPDTILQRDSSASYLFLSDILQQAEGVVPPGFPASGVNNQVLVYGLRGDIVNGDADTVARLNRGFTNSIQTISLVIDPAALFDSGKGIYVNAKGNGKGWERPTMVEQIDPVNGASKEFSVPAGIRIRGAYSRGSAYPKHSLRLFFRGEYGMSKLKFPLFGDEGTDEFKKVDLRTAQNYSWANGNVNAFTFIEECFSRDSQRDMGEPYNRSRYYNLFINGVYWGVYQTEERVDRHYAESYNGDVDDNYDVIRTSQPGYNTGVVEGEGAAWHDFWDITVNEGYGAAHPRNYNRVRGLNPDGTRNPDYPVYLNETNVMVYMITSHYSVDSDSPASTGGRANNLAVFRDRFDGQGLRDGFIWNRHDAEHSLGTRSGYPVTKTDFYKMGTREQAATLTEESNFNAAELHYELCSNAEYRVKFADQVYKHCLKPGGAMTAPVAEARFRSRMAELDDAVVCEAARWGRTNQTYSTWLEKGCAGRLSFIASRTPYLIQGYRNAGWYPSIDPPVAVDSSGCELTNGTVLATSDAVYFTGVGGTVYYTTDGSDPRLEGGAVSASATAFTGEGGLPVPVDGLAIKARRLSQTGEWSALEDVTLVADVPNDTALGVRVAAVYSSTLDGGGDGSEFIVLTNLLGRAVSLEGVRITCAKTGKTPSLDITLGAGREIPAGGSVKLTKAGDWPSTKITNGAVDIKVYDPDGNAIQTLHVDANWWSGACDGTGAYFVALEFGDTVTAIGQWTSFMPSVQSLAIRVAAVYSSTADGGGDGAEFIVFTNLLDRAVSLEGLRFTCAKAGAAPGVDITLGAGREISANGTVTLTKAEEWPSKKITNGAVDILVYDSDGATIQTLHVDASWWPVREYLNDKGKVKYVCACDGTGAHFIALEFGEAVTTEAQWKPSFLPPPTEAGENAIIAAVSADDRVRTWLDAIAATAAGHASITNFSGEAAAVQAAYLVGLDTLADPQADLFFENISVGAGGRVTFDGDLKVQGARWRQKVNGTLRLYGYPELGGSPSVTDIPLEGGKFPLVGAEDTSGTNRFFKLVIE